MSGQLSHQDVLYPCHVNVCAGEISHEVEIGGFDKSQLVDLHSAEFEIGDFKGLRHLDAACNGRIALNKRLQEKIGKNGEE